MISTVQLPALGVPFRRGGPPILPAWLLRDVAPPEHTVLLANAFDVGCPTVQEACTKGNFSLATFTAHQGYDVILGTLDLSIGNALSAPPRQEGVCGATELGRKLITPADLAVAASALKVQGVLPIAATFSVDESPAKRRKTAETRNATWFADLVARSHGVSVASMSGGVPMTDFKGCATDATPVLAADRSMVYAPNLFLGESPADRSASLRLIKSNSGDKTALLVCGETLLDLLDIVDVWGPRVVFGTAWPWRLAAQGRAIVLPAWCFQSSHDGGADPAMASCDSSAYPSEPHSEVMMINLRDPIHRLAAARPLCPWCTCPCCRRHSRAYVHHLLTVQEMNSDILLVAHNLACLSHVLALLGRAMDLPNTTERLRTAISFTAE